VLAIASAGAGLAACTSDDDADTSGGAPEVAPYQPADAAPQPPLPPGAGPRAKTDASTPPPADAGQDVQQDAPGDAPTD
jgi:hypothetical protein